MKLPWSSRPARTLRVWSVLLGWALSLGSCSGTSTGGVPAGSERTSPDATHEARLEVAVSIPPLAWLVERLGSERVTTQVLLPPGSSPATYEPSLRQVVALDRARLYVVVGHPDFPFERRLLERWLDHRRSLPVVALTSSLGELTLRHGHAHEHGGRLPEPGKSESKKAEPGDARPRDVPSVGDPEIDPHVWVAPATMAAAAEPVAQALAEADPAGAGVYRKNLATLRHEIERLDRDLAAQLDNLPRRRFWVYHPAWGYLARQYGLEQVALEAGGKELSPARLVRLVERARREKVSVIFVQRGFSDRAARALAAETGARVEVLDPLAYDWPENLRSVAAKLREALSTAGDTAAGTSPQASTGR